MTKKRKTKLKTRKSVAKRFKITKTGKVIRRGAQNRHLKANRSKRNTRRSRVPKVVTGRMAKKIKKMLGQ
jgi:large subunit ribosomal protein L35